MTLEVTTCKLAAKRRSASATVRRPDSIAEQIQEPTFPLFIALKSARRGVRQDGMVLRTPRRKPLFLHLLLATSSRPGYAPERIWLDDVELDIRDGWAFNPELCDGKVSLVNCEVFSEAVTSEIMARCHNYHGMQAPEIKGVSYMYLQLEWRRGMFPQIPVVRVNP